jgi:hypothetical protein
MLTRTKLPLHRPGKVFSRIFFQGSLTGTMGDGNAKTVLTLEAYSR